MIPSTSDETPAQAQARRREARRTLDVQAAYDRLLARVSPFAHSRVRVEMRRPFVRVAAGEVGHVAVFWELHSGELELSWTGRLESGASCTLPVPVKTTARVLALWAPLGGSARRSAAALLDAAVDMDGASVG